MKQQEFVDKLNAQRNKEYTLISTFINLREPIEVKCNNCNHIFKVIPKNFLKNKGSCPVCKNGRIRTTSDLKDYIRYKFDEYELTGEYTSCESEVSVVHKKCGTIISMSEHSLIRDGKIRCPVCDRNIKNSEEWYLNEIRKRYKDEWVLLDNYKGMQTKIRHRHKCGNIINTTPYLFLKNKYNCIKCSNYKHPRLLSNEEYSDKLQNVFHGEYEKVDDYINSTTNINVKHNCGCVFSVSPHKLFSFHTMCPVCNSSKGENIIRNFLNSNNILFKQEYCFDDCKDIKLLPFDFAIFDNQNNIKCLIEYDGQQHFEPIDYFGGEESYKKQQKHDRIKTTYCINNDIELIRIPYYEFNNIDNILNQKLF